MIRLSRAGGLVALVVTFATSTAASAQTARFVAPPRTIADITAFLDQEKPDPAKRAKTEAEAASEPPAKADRAALKQFYLHRAQARAMLGRSAAAAADAERAAAHSSDYVNDGSRIEAYQAQQMRAAGDYEGAIKLLERIAQKLNVTVTNKGRAFLINERIVINLLSLGEVAKAEAYVDKNRALLAEARSWSQFDLFGSNWAGMVEEGNNKIFGARGRHRDAELAARKTQTFYRDSLVKSKSWPFRPERDSLENAIDWALNEEGCAKARQGRLVEAEIDLRRALLARLNTVGKFHNSTATMLYTLAWVLNEQGRFADGETLSRASVEVFDVIGVQRSAITYVQALSNLGGSLFAQRKYEELRRVIAAIDAAIAPWPAARQASFTTGFGRIFSNYYLGNIAEGLEFAKAGFARSKLLKGEQHYGTALARAALAAGLSFAKRDAEAMQEFRAALPILLGAANPADDEDATVTINADRLLQTLLEPYMALLARSNLADAADESLRIADAIRSRSVQNALGAAAIRASAQTPALAELVRKEQDLRKQISAQTGLLRNVLADAPENRQKEILDALQKELKTLRTQSEDTGREIRRRFPAYANLTRPTPVTSDEIRAALKPDESLVSFYFGDRNSFAWAVPKSGPIAFSVVALSGSEMDSRVAALRRALDEEVDYISDMPEFNLDLAHGLYKALLEPVATGWRPAKQLVVVTNGSLGLLPLGLLPTEAARIKTAGQPYFASYRDVAWLARTHAVVSVPSASALRTLRGLAPAPSNRETFVGFGDPIFSAEAPAPDVSTVALNTTADVTRGVKMGRRAVAKTLNKRSVVLGDLQRLPDTADELKAIAAALQVDPEKVLHLGKAANERTVTGTDLSRYRIIAFATHGLKPGDLDGLTQPALALTAPAVANIEGDGLLTVEKILALKLNADWVVLSACNTAAGADAGAEAVSGLGRAFFYAGSRALLATNWAVHSESARELVSDVFRRQASDPNLTRAEALRQAMVSLLDTGANKDEAGRIRFTYAHPFFWAPYSIVGDGG